MIQVERRQNDEPGGERLLDGLSGSELRLCVLVRDSECVVGNEVGVLGMRLSGCVRAEETVG